MACLRYAVCGCCLCIKNANCYNSCPAIKWLFLPESSLDESPISHGQKHGGGALLPVKTNGPESDASWPVSLCRWWGSNSHVLLAQGILSFGNYFPSGAIWWYRVISDSRLTSNFLAVLRIKDWFLFGFSIVFPSAPFSGFGVSKRKLEGYLGGMQSKTPLCLGTKWKESQG